jgi:hypothetical protein
LRAGRTGSIPPRRERSKSLCGSYSSRVKAVRPHARWLNGTGLPGAWGSSSSFCFEVLILCAHPRPELRSPTALRGCTIRECTAHICKHQQTSQRSRRVGLPGRLLLLRHFLAHDHRVSRFGVDSGSHGQAAAGDSVGVFLFRDHAMLDQLGIRRGKLAANLCRSRRRRRNGRGRLLLGGTARQKRQ